jgi:glutamate synthase (NADPH/NADH) large chain
MADMRNQDVERLHTLIARHAHYTNSQTAQKILKDFAAYLPKFKKVMPVEYRRALSELAKERGVTVDSTTPDAAEITARNTRNR